MSGPKTAQNASLSFLAVSSSHYSVQSRTMGLNPMHRIAAAALLLSVQVFAATLDGRVVGVTDGDTITVLDDANVQHKIRLSGIDAPERAQPFGDRSKTNLSRLTFDQRAQVEWTKRDRYQRVIGKVLVNGRDVNLEQVKSGMAWWYRAYAREQSPQDREDYEVAEFRAKSSRTGLWSEKNPLPPWDWRHK